ncbi:hypothetical protein G6F35_008099 [Rhizopus arrhizus]|nr:hypothetical protein G6F35_008099 [Rhizopus arrhizus]
MELAKFGEVEDMVVCDNVGDHLVGNVYCQYRLEESAGNAVESLNNRFYAGRPLYAELSPVTDFREACCRQHEIAECNRGGFCNFMHLKHPTRTMRRELYEGQRMDIREKRKEETKRDEDERRAKHEPYNDDYKKVKHESYNEDDYRRDRHGSSDRREVKKEYH